MGKIIKNKLFNKDKKWQKTAQELDELAKIYFVE
jgi:hypothetical protein